MYYMGHVLQSQSFLPFAFSMECEHISHNVLRVPMEQGFSG